MHWPASSRPCPTIRHGRRCTPCCERSAPRPPPVAQQVDLAMLREACWAESVLTIRYRDLRNRTTEREIWPLRISYSAGAVKLLAWCCLRDDWRVFHVAGIEAAEAAGRSFRPRRVALLHGYAGSRDGRMP